MPQAGKSAQQISRSPHETIVFAEKFAKVLKPGTVISLEGNLGSGKTTFIKGIARGLGLSREEEVKSPTFVLMHIYPTSIPLYHFDLYRLETAKELEAIGFEEFIYNRKAISCVEWGEKAGGLLPKTSYHVELKFVNDHTREIRIKAGKVDRTTKKGL